MYFDPSSPGFFTKAWSEDQHPRDDHGRFSEVSQTSAADHAGVHDLIRQTMGDSVIPQLKTDLAHGGKSFVIRHEGKVIAHGMSKPSFAADDVHEVGWLATHPDFQGHGLASKMLSGLEDHARSTGANAMVLATATPEFYRKRGYRTIHAATGLMAKPLTAEKIEELGFLAKVWSEGQQRSGSVSSSLTLATKLSGVRLPSSPLDELHWPSAIIVAKSGFGGNLGTLAKINLNHGHDGRFTFAAETGGGSGGSSTRYERYHVPDETSKWLGFDENLSLAVDPAALLHRHPECFSSEDEVRADINFVLNSPSDWWPHAHGRAMIVRYSQDGGPALRIKVEGTRGNMRVASIYAMDKSDIERNLARKEAWIEERRRAGSVPVSPTVAEFLRERVGPPMPPHSGVRRSSTTIVAKTGLDVNLGKLWDESKHPRAPAGDAKGGEFVPEDNAPDVAEDAEHFAVPSNIGTEYSPESSVEALHLDRIAPKLLLGLGLTAAAGLGAYVAYQNIPAFASLMDGVAATGDLAVSGTYHALQSPAEYVAWNRMTNDLAATAEMANAVGENARAAGGVVGSVIGGVIGGAVGKTPVAIGSGAAIGSSILSPAAEWVGRGVGAIIGTTAGSVKNIETLYSPSHFLAYAMTREGARRAGAAVGKAMGIFNLPLGFAEDMVP